MKENELKRELILNASEDIVTFLNEKYGIDVDYCDIAEFINTNLGFVFNALDEAMLKPKR